MEATAQTAVVTGAGRGIGKEISIRLARRGFAVLVTDVDEAAARQTAEEIGAPAWALGLDVRDPDAHRRAAAAACERGRLSVWVNNAGVLRTRKAWEHSDEEARLLVEVNLLGTIWGSRAAVDAMRDHGGRILNLASMSAFGPVPGLAIYGASKHGVLGFSTSLQGDLELAGIPIRVHAICPDTVDTEMVQEREDDPESALLFTAPRLLGAGEVADRTVALLDGETLVLAIPRRRAWLLRLTAPFPRFSLRVTPLFRRLGDRKRRRRGAQG